MTTQNVITNVKTMMLLDNLTTNQQTSLEKMINQILENELFINSLKGNIDGIISDNQLTVSDIPKIMLLQLDIQNNLPKLLNLKNSLELWEIKYLCFATLLFCVYKWYPSLFNDSFTPDLFGITFSNMWSLVSINPSNITNVTNNIKEKCSFCC